MWCQIGTTYLSDQWEDSLPIDINVTKSYEFFVPGRPVPWSAPDVGLAKNGRRFARKNPKLTAWQAELKAVARAAYGPLEPHRGPIYLELCFGLPTKDESLHGKLVIPRFEDVESQDRVKKMGRQLADRTNLIKAVEDGIQGVLFLDDTQVRAGQDVCLWSHVDLAGVNIFVGLIDEENPFAEA
jgi:Holliday junction resolvase RusA-like endonuclease